MTNHNPTISSSNATGSFGENANTTGSNALHNLSGTMNFTDSDRSDTHTTTASLKTVALSSGSIIPATSLAHLNAAMSSMIQTDSNGSGKLKWSFSAEDDDFDFLSKNQSLTLTYEIKLKDNHGGQTTKLVTITVTGTDDKPIIDFGTHAVISERPNQTLSFANDTANIAVHFTDVDLTNTGHTATVIDADVSGDTYGLLAGESTLKSFLNINSVVKVSGSSNGTINTTFSAPDLLFDYLGAGDSIDITYTLKLDDHAGGITNQTLIVTIVGTNDKPYYLSGPDTKHLVEGEGLSPAGDLTAHGDFLFGDIDLSDGHTVSTTATATRSGGGAVPLTNAQLVAALSTDVDPDSTNHLLGEVDWSFGLDNDDVAFLNSGETLTIVYTLTLSDGNGGTDTRTVTITVLGTNDPVIVTSGAGAASLAEFADTTGSAVLNTTTPVPTGTITFADPDVGDTHTVSVTVDSAVWSGGPAVPAGTEADLPAALLTTLNDSTGTGSGSIDWTFSIADQDLDFLAAGETMTVTYNVAVSDGPTSASQTVTITVDGANDAVVMTSGPGSASLTEFAATSNSNEQNSTSPVPTGTLSFTDVDLSDFHSIGVALSSVVWSTGGEAPGATQFDLQFALQTILNDSFGTGSGSVDWTFSIQDRDLDFLSAGDTLTVTYDVTVADALTTSTQQVTITINGAADSMVVNSLEGVVADHSFADAGFFVSSGNVIADANDSPGDGALSLEVATVNGSAGNVGTPIAGTYGTLTIFSDGSYFYEANANLDLLQVGDTATEVYTFEVTNGSETQTATLTLNVSGADDTPVVTSADTSASLTEDAGPTANINGGFETGTLAGWTASGTHISVEFTGLGGEFGDYSAKLAPTSIAETLSQDVATTPGSHYILSFYVSGDSESSANSMTVTWDGVTVLGVVNQFGGLTHYAFDVVATDSNSTLSFTYTDDGVGMLIDTVTVNPTPGPATEIADGTITFSDIEIADTHTASFFPVDSGYVGTFSLDPLSESSGSGSVAWHFTVDNADIQYLSLGQSVVQTYFVQVTDNFGESAFQSVSITLNGSNDAPTAVNDTVISNAGAGGTIDIPAWALAANDTDPDMLDTVFANSILSSSGGSAVPFGDAFFFDDATPGGSFTYDVVDNNGALSGAGTVTIVNNPTTTTALVGTGGDDIIIANNGSESLSGGGGNDVLFGNSGNHALTGGLGDDIFAFRQSDNTGVISDFNNVTEQDQLAFSASGYGGGMTEGMDTALIFESSSDAFFQFTDSRFHYDMSTSTLYYSADGTDASAISVLQTQSGVVLNPHDLLIVT